MSLPSYRGAGCRGFSIRSGMCHQRPHPLRWGFRDPYWSSWSCAMCPRRDAWDTGAGPAGLDRALGDTECAMRVPPGATEWHSISRQLYICRLPHHSAPPSAQSACHSPPSSGAREAARLEGHQRDGRHRIARGSEPSGGAAPDGGTAVSGPSRAAIPDAIRRCAGLCRAGPPARPHPPSTSKGIWPTRGKQPSSVSVRIKSR